VAVSELGYGAITLMALKGIELDSISKRYGMPNDLLVKLNIYQFKVRDVPVNPFHGIGERSGIKICHAIFTLTPLLMELFL